jgi:hypothetical protein
MFWSRMMVVCSKVATTIFGMACTCAMMLLFLVSLDAFWSSFALLTPRGHFDVGGTSKVMSTVQALAHHHYLSCCNHLDWSFFSLAVKSFSFFLTCPPT